MAQGTSTRNDSMISATHVVNGIVGGLVGGVALVAMPARLGMDLFMINEMSLRSLMGHLVFGGILGGVVALLARRGTP